MIHHYGNNCYPGMGRPNGGAHATQGPAHHRTFAPGGPGHPSARVTLKDLRKESSDGNQGREGCRTVARRAGVGIIGVTVVFGLTTASGGPDWVGIVTAIAGLVMVLTGLFRAFRKGTPHTS